ncbi:DNA polymerase alpha/epsilon subunit B-domain-containing protein [Limtongia smithiae]|uniref:DNA polymerase alpha/epsilon subunit B-domain-containing protein n=1 Tax=Limtongia smithiae TaxID=1125753 RepID=UPI0034CF5F06
MSNMAPVPAATIPNDLLKPLTSTSTNDDYQPLQRQTIATFLSDDGDDRVKTADDSTLLVKYNKEFVVNKTAQSYELQYANVYFLRLAILKPRVEKIAAEAWNGMKISNHTVIHVPRVLDVQQGHLCWITGTIYMDMPLKPNILDEVTSEFWSTKPVSDDKFADPARDTVMLEDESGRVQLVFSGGVSSGAGVQQYMSLVTGCVVAVLGSETPDGEFEVVDIRVADLAPQTSLQRPLLTGQQRESNSKKRYIALVSGVSVSGDEHERYETDMLVEYLTGELTGSSDTGHAKDIVHVIFAGNSFASTSTSAGTPDLVTKRSGKQHTQTYTPAPGETLDSILAEIAFSVPVDLMPGAHDPTNATVPQQPLHPLLLPRARGVSTFRATTNPCWWKFGDVKILGTGGQMIDDIFKYVEDTDRLKMMENTLRWQHCAPTAPDTLWTYPFADRDPFLLEETPHVYFAGSQPSFQTMLIHGSENQVVRLIALPKFAETAEIVLLDVDTLTCELVKFRVRQ